MKRFAKIILLLVLFSIAFYLLRTEGHYIGYRAQTLVSDLGGLTYLYSTVAIIFAIFAAFVILSESDRWNNLVDATKGEVNELHELWLWSRHFPEPLSLKFNDDIKEYLKAITEDEFYKEEKSIRVEKAIDVLHEDIYKLLKDAPDLTGNTFENFREILKYQEQRLHYMSFHLPKILKNTLIFSDITLVFLSFLIGVKNNWLDYIFLVFITLLCYLIYIVVDDLDNPTRPGGWEITVENYSKLLTKIENTTNAR